MNKVIYIAILIFASIVNAQTAEEIVAKHFDVTGGYEQWNALSSITIEAEVAIGVSDVAPLLIEHKRPYFKRVSYIIDGQEKLNEGFDGKHGYTYDENNHKFKRLARYEPDAFETDLLNYKKKGFKVKLEGTEKINGKETYKIELTKNTVQDYYWIDVKSYQLIKEVNAIETIYYKDLRKFEGLTFATRMEIKPHRGAEYVLIFNDIKPNASIPEARFKFN
ncbi:MAG: outer membrane lipoprotein-sorting protein [Weeksellaceae bacterium]